MYQTFAFTIYLRLVLESNQFILLSSFSELKTWHTTGTARIVSLWLAFAAAGIWVSLIAVSFVHWLSHRQLENTDHYMPLKELFGGLKDHSKPRLYSTLLLTRRCFLVAFLVAASSLTSLAIVVPMLVVQTVYVSLMTALRPYKSTKDNLLEVINEVYYFVMIAMLVHYNSDTKWSKTAETAYLWIIIANSLTIIHIMISKSTKFIFKFLTLFLVAIIINLIIKLIKKCKETKVEIKSSEVRIIYFFIINYFHEISFAVFLSF